MDQNLQPRHNYSASVDLRLEAKGRAWPLAKTGRDHFVPAERFELEACDAVIVATVDGEEHRSNVRVVSGVRFCDTRVAIERNR
jgi:hypothetical protein